MNEYDDITSQLYGPSPKPPASPYDEIVKEQKAGERDSAAASLTEAVRSDPDTFAKALRLERTTGVPADVAERNIPAVEAQQKMNEYDVLLSTSPVLTKQMMNPTFTRLTHDDGAAMSALEKGLNTIGVAAQMLNPLAASMVKKSGGGKEMADIATGLTNTGVAALSAPPSLAAKLFDAEALVLDVLSNATRGILPYDVAGHLSESARLTANRARQGIADAGYQGDSTTARAALSGVTSGVESLILLPIGVANGAKAFAGAMALLAGSQSNTAARDKGLDTISSLTYAMPDAAFEFLFEIAPAAQLFGDIAKHTNLRQMMWQFTKKEVVGEEMTTLSQNFNEWMRLNPEKTTKQFLAEVPGEAYNTLIATLVGASVQTGAARAAQIVVNSGQEQAARTAEADARAQYFKNAFDLAAATKVKVRDVATLSAFVQDVADSNKATPSSLFIDANTLDETLQQSGVTMEAFVEMVPAVADQVQSALASGGVIELPIGDLVANVAGTPLEASLIKNLRISPEDLSQVEDKLASEQAAKNLSERAAEAVATAEESDAFAASAEAVRVSILDQLTAIDRNSESVNADYASAVADFYTVMAQREGMTPEALFQRNQLTIASRTAGEADATTLDQSGGVQQPVNKYAAKFLAGRDVATLSEDERAQYDSLVADTLPVAAPPYKRGLLSAEAKQLDIAAVQKVAPSAQLRSGIFQVDPSEFDAAQKVVAQQGVELPADEAFNQDAAQSQTDTPAFKKWFGDSKVVDAEGRPLVVYHGTKNPPTKFAKSRTGSASSFLGDYKVERFGIFAAEDSALAEEYASQGENPTDQAIMPVFMSIKNPLDTVGENYTDWKWSQIEKAAKELGADNPYAVARHIGDLWGRGALWKLFDVDEHNDPAWNIKLFRKAGWDGMRISERSEGDVQNTAAWVAFEPTQIKSAIGNNQNFDSADANILHQSQVWRSALRDGIAESKSAAAPAAGWQDAIKGLINKGTAKADEVEWSGITDWLKLQSGKVSKEQVLDYLDGNGVRVTETALGDASFDATFSEEGDEGLWHVYGERANEGDVYETAAEAKAKSDAYNADIPAGPTKYSQYQLPGGTNYREVLLTLPVVRGSLTDDQHARLQYLQHRKTSGAFDMQRGPLLAELTQLETTGRGTEYKSSHWEQSNVLAHIRVNDRTDADGSEVLFVEEIQSDWGQAGKKEGFKAEYQTRMPVITSKILTGNEFVAERSMPEAAAKFWLEGKNNIRKDLDLPPMKMDDQFTVIYEDGTPVIVKDGVSESAAEKHRARYQKMLDAGKRNFEVDQRDKVPSAPFVGKTDAWVALAIKRVIKMAAEGGYDKVAFVNGEQSAERYDLSKSVSEVIYTPDVGGGTLNAIDEEGNNTVITEQNVSLEKLQDYIGKDAAAKLLAQPLKDGAHSLSGPDLKVGGEGMKAFYDKIVPSVAKDVLRKLGGGQMESVTIGDSASPAVKSMSEKDRARLGLADSQLTQPGFTITDAMREKAAGGMALFQNKPAKKPHGSFSPSQLKITLLETANLTTFLHESGHLFLTIMADLASDPNASAGIKADMDVILKWMGVPDLATWNTGTVDQQRPYHEKFARGFEAYLFEGKSPSLKMNGAFRRFSAWMLRWYKSLAALDVTLTDEVRGVFDRILATEKQIEEARQSRAYNPLFADAQAAGMTPEAWKAYQDLGAQQVADAKDELQTRSLRDMRLLTNAHGRALKELQAEEKARRSNMQAEVKAEVLQEPVYAVQHWIKGNGFPDGTEAVGAKLSMQALKDMYGEEPAAPWRYLATNLVSVNPELSLHPDDIADVFDFESGDDMVRAMVSADPIAVRVEGLTDQRMLERYGDVATPEAMARAADEAVHNDARSRFVATELIALQKATNVREKTAAGGTVNVMLRAAREYASNIIGGKAVKDVKPHLYAAAEARAARQAVQALKDGDLAAAATAKRNEVLNNALTREAYKVLAELEKSKAFLRRVATGKDDVVGKTRDMDVVNAARAIVSQYGIGAARGKTALAYMDVLAHNDPVLYASLKPSVDTALANAKPFNLLTVEEARGLHDEIDGMWHMAKRTREMIVGGELVDRKVAEDALMERMQEIGIPDTMPGDTSAVTPMEKNLAMLRTVKAAGVRVEAWAGAKDGAATIGPFRKYVWQVVKEPADAYRMAKAVYLNRYRALIDTVAPFMKHELIAAPELNYTFGKGKGGIGTSELLHAILHTGNESNKRKLLLGRKWATQDAEGNLDTRRWDTFVARMITEGKLTKAHYDFAQGVWDMLESTKELAQRAHRDVFGKYFSEVTAQPFDTPFGSYRGGYVPAIADPDIVQDAAIRALSEMENENMAFAFPATSKGFTKGRVEYNRPLKLDLRSIGQHLDKVLLFSHMEQPIRDVRKLLSSKGVSYALGRIDPPAFGSLITPWLNRAARQQVETPIVGDGGAARWFGVMRNNAGMAAMFANVSNSVQQITGASLAFIKVDAKYLLAATAQWTAAPKVTNDTVAAASPYMANRMRNEVGAMNSAINDILLDPSMYESTKAWTARHAYFMQAAVDNVVGPMIWIGAYNQALERGSVEADAIRLADSAVRETQGSALPEDVSRIETGNAFVRLFTQFMGYYNMWANLLGGEFAKIQHAGGLRQGAGRAVFLVTMGYMVPAILAEAVTQIFRGGPGDDDKDGEWLDDWLREVFAMGPIRTAAAMVPIAGPLALGIFNATNSKPYDDRLATSPAISMVESAVRSPVSVYKAIVDNGSKRKAVRDVATLLSMMTGLPAAALARPLGYLAGVKAGEMDPTGPVDAARGVVTGSVSPDSKR